MLRVGQLRRSSGPPADAPAVSGWPSGLGAWGEGLVDRSLTSLWYSADWNEVADDELVFLLPTLAVGAEVATQGNKGPQRYLTRTLKARVATTAALLASSARCASAPQQALSLLSARSIVTSLSLDEILAPPADPGPAPHWPTAARDGTTSEALPAWLSFEFTALAHLDRLLLDARGAARAVDAAPLVDWPLSLADVVLASIHARFNGVYLHPEFAHAHELLTAAALLGHLASGRPAYLPPPVAQSLVDLLSEKSAFGDDEWCARIVRTHADLAGGAEYLLRLARRAAASERPLLANPRPPLMPSDAGSTTWNARLLQRIALRWRVSA